MGESRVASGWHGCAPVLAVETQAPEELGRGHRRVTRHQQEEATIRGQPGGPASVPGLAMLRLGADKPMEGA